MLKVNWYNLTTLCDVGQKTFRALVFPHWLGIILYQSDCSHYDTQAYIKKAIIIPIKLHKIMSTIPWIRGPRETKESRRQGKGGTSGRTREASVRPHQSNEKVQNLGFSVIGLSKCRLSNVVKIECKYV